MHEIENEAENEPVEKQGWDAKKLSDEATNKESDEIVRQIKRGDETKGDADERDVAGSPEKSETPQGREETKKNNQE